MSTDLTTWLSAHRLDLISQWADLIGESVASPMYGDSSNDGGVILTLSKTTVSVEQLYDMLVLAAEGLSLIHI